MSDMDIHSPEHWRRRAEEARAIAENMIDPDAKKAMLEAASTYENIARRMEAEAQNNVARKPL